MLLLLLLLHMMIVIQRFMVDCGTTNKHQLQIVSILILRLDLQCKSHGLENFDTFRLEISIGFIGIIMHFLQMVVVVDTKVTL